MHAKYKSDLILTDTSIHLKMKMALLSSHAFAVIQEIIMLVEFGT